MKYSLYATLIALAALTVKADERYCDGAMQDPEADMGTMSWAAFKSARLIFGNYTMDGQSTAPEMKSLHTANMVDCFKECAHDQLEDAFVDVKPGRTRGVYCRGVRYFEFEDKTQNKCTLMNTPPTEVIPLTEMQEKMGWFGGGTYGGCDAENAQGLSKKKGVACCEIWFDADKVLSG